VSEWGLDKAVLSLCAARICRMVLAEYVREEVEENLLKRAVELSPAAADQVIDDYSKLLKLARPEIIPLPSAREVARSRHLIRHAADVPVLLSAIQAQPDWLLTHNTQHFSPRSGRKRVAQGKSAQPWVSAVLTLSPRSGRQNGRRDARMRGTAAARYAGLAA